MTLTIQELDKAIRGHSEKSDWLSILCEEIPESRDEMLLRAGQILLLDPIQDSLENIKPSFDTISYSEMADRCLLVGYRPDGEFVAVLGVPLASGQGWWLSQRARRAAVYLADPKAVSFALANLEAGFSAVAEAVGLEHVAALAVQASAELSLSSIQEESSPAVRLIDSTLFDALRFEASDIHMETVADGMLIKFRIDGVLNQIAALRNSSLAEQAIARIKVLADLDIAEKRVPQDGRYRVLSKGRDIDIRVSIMPTIHGEDAVLRILDKQALIDSMQQLTLGALGFDQPTIRQLRRMAAEPYGMLLVTGPTGSGKTTTLYAMLTEINTGSDKILTIEDPVEYQLPGVAQIPVNEKKGLSFSVGLRSILRHDPDKILVGEIRDPDTAQIAVQSALTGHMVFTSVHANNTFDVIGRFMHMGVDPYSFVSSLSGVVAQRLVRQNCANCSESVEVPDDLIRESGIAISSDYQFMAGKGCPVCRNTGYRGRKAIAEVLRLTDEIKEMIIGRASIRHLKEQARREGTRFLRDVALDLVREGHTTLQEANRVTFVA